MSEPTCCSCQNPVNLETATLLDCLHVVCELCLNDVRNEANRVTRCPHENCNYVFVPDEARLFAHRDKRVCIEGNDVTSRQAFRFHLDTIRTTGKVLDKIDKAKKDAVTLQSNNNAHFDALAQVHVIIDQHIAYYQQLKEYTTKVVNQHAEARHKTLDRLNANIKGFDDRYEGLMETTREMMVNAPQGFHAPIPFLEHVNHQARRLDEEAEIDLVREIQNFPKLEFQFTEGSRFNVFFKTIRTTKPILLPYNLAQPKFSFKKQELFGDDWQTASFEWTNPYHIIWHDIKNKRSVSINPELWGTPLATTVLLEGWDEKNPIKSHVVTKEGFIGFIHKNNTISRSNYLDRFYVKSEPDFFVNNFPFTPTGMCDKKPGVVYFSSGEEMRLDYYNNEERRNQLYFRHINEQIQRPPAYNVSFFATPGIQEPLLYDNKFKRAYPVNHLAVDVNFSLAHYENVVAAFTARTRQSVHVFLASSSEFVRVVDFGGQEVASFPRPAAIGNERIIDVVLINDTSFFMETETSIFIF